MRALRLHRLLVCDINSLPSLHNKSVKLLSGWQAQIHEIHISWFADVPSQGWANSCLLQKDNTSACTTLLCSKTPLTFMRAFPLDFKDRDEAYTALCFPAQSHLASGCKYSRASQWGLNGNMAFVQVTYGICIGVYLVSIVTPSIWGPIQIIGATAGAVIGFIIPGEDCSMFAQKFYTADIQRCF